MPGGIGVPPTCAMADDVAAERSSLHVDANKGTISTVPVTLQVDPNTHLRTDVLLTTIGDAEEVASSELQARIPTCQKYLRSTPGSAAQRHCTSGFEQGVPTYPRPTSWQGHDTRPAVVGEWGRINS